MCFAPPETSRQPSAARADSNGFTDSTACASDNGDFPVQLHISELTRSRTVVIHCEDSSTNPHPRNVRQGKCLLPQLNFMTEVKPVQSPRRCPGVDSRVVPNGLPSDLPSGLLDPSEWNAEVAKIKAAVLESNSLPDVSIPGTLPLRKSVDLALGISGFCFVNYKNRCYIPISGRDYRSSARWWK